MSTSKNKIFCFIPAKAASTRLKKKNIVKLDGKELIYYPINNAIRSGLFEKEDIILSTESKEIKSIAEKYGANVPYLREEKLARDPYGVVDVLLDFLARFPKFKEYDSVCILLPTAPLMEVEDLLNGVRKYEEGRFDSVLSLTTNDHSALRSVFVRDQLVKPIFEEFILKKSQELETTYRLNGAVSILKLKAFLKIKSFNLPPCGSIILSRERSVDIDDIESFNYAEYLKLSNNGKNK